MHQGLRQLTTSPLKSLLVIYTFIIQSWLILLKRLLLPHLFVYQSLRTQLHRAYLISTYLLPRLPVQCTPEEAKLIVGADWKGYVIPGTRSLQHWVDLSGARRKVVALYAHGGGYGWGEATQYLPTMNRWVKCAETVGMELVFVSVEYPLSGEAPHPAQLHAFTNAYKHLLDLGILSSNIVFMGDSAGGGLSILTSLNIQKLTRPLPQPSALLLISPWLDLTNRVYDNGGNALSETDYVNANTVVPMLSTMFLASHDPLDPAVNPLLHEPLALNGMAPQLIVVGGGEFAVQEGRDWAILLLKAGVRHEFVVERGQVHIFAMGSMWVDPVVKRRTDERIVKWLGAQTRE